MKHFVVAAPLSSHLLRFKNCINTRWAVKMQYWFKPGRQTLSLQSLNIRQYSGIWFMTASLNLFKHFPPTVEKLGLHFPPSSETSRENHLSQSILIYQPLLIWCSYEERLTVNSIHEFIMCSITLSISIYLNRSIQNMFAFVLVKLKTV